MSIDFNKWREDYESSTLQDQVEFHNKIEKEYPTQAHFNYENVKEALSLAPQDAIVLEFGCWKGDLANMAIPEFKIKQWIGIEICDAAIANTNCKRPEFFYDIPDRFDWFNEPFSFFADIVIATHFIEHLSDDHFNQLANYCRIGDYPIIYFEAPLTEDGQSWQGYEGTHKLTYGWRKVITVMMDNGYSVHKRLTDGVIFKTA